MNRSRAVILLVPLLALIGCESGSTTHEDLRRKQDQVLKDPWGYDPSSDTVDPANKDKSDPTDITGGGMMNYDKDAMHRDLNHVFNP